MRMSLVFRPRPGWKRSSRRVLACPTPAASARQPSRFLSRACSVGLLHGRVRWLCRLLLVLLRHATASIVPRFQGKADRPARHPIAALTRTAARRATLPRGQAPGLLACPASAYTPLGTRGHAISDRSLAPEEQGSGCRLGRWCLSVPHLRRKCRGRVLTYSGVARPPLVPGLFQVRACASTGHGQASGWHHLVRGRLAGASRPAPESTGAGPGDGRGG
jgi:hypothetical protein